MPHEEFSEYLRGRYYLSPSKLYSVVRPAANRQGYDVPVEGEWVTVAVVATKGDIRISHSTRAIADDEGDSKSKDGPSPKKNVTYKLVDFGTASHDSKRLRGDALLKLILFEADSVSTAREASSRKVHRTYKGGSGGAFEESAKLFEGAVIAICSPRVLKPFQVKFLLARYYIVFSKVL